MEKRLFYSEMARLSVAFDRAIEPKLLETYWDRVKNHNDTLFVRAVDRLIDGEEYFPSVAHIHKAYYIERDAERDAVKGGELSEAEYRALGEANARRLAIEGIQSDHWKKGEPVVHRPGSRGYDRIMHIFEKQINVLLTRVDQLGTETEARPNDHDVARRFRRLLQLYGELEACKTQFEQHGFIPDEMLPKLDYELPGDTSELGIAREITYACLRCRDRRFVRVEVPPGVRHFAGMGAGSKHTPIPCPDCNEGLYSTYVATYGVPPGMPAFA